MGESGGGGSLYSEGWGGRARAGAGRGGSLYGEFRDIMGNGHMESPPPTE